MAKSKAPRRHARRKKGSAAIVTETSIGFGGVTVTRKPAGGKHRPVGRWGALFAKNIDNSGG
jgi:hypothetical protein